MAVLATLTVGRENPARRADRWIVRRAATLDRKDERRHNVLLRNISIHGCFIITGVEIAFGAHVHVNILGAGQVHAKIVRRASDGYGCQFIDQLNPSVIERVLLAGRTVPSEQLELRNALHAQPFIKSPAPAIKQWSRSIRVVLILSLSTLTWILIVFAFSRLF